MKKVICIVLVLVMAFSLSACLSSEARECRNDILTLNADIKDYKKVADIGFTYQWLTDEKKKEIDDSRLIEIETKMLDMKYSPFYCCKELQSQLVNPESMTILGDVFCVKLVKDGLSYYYYDILINAKGRNGNVFEVPYTITVIPHDGEIYYTAKGEEGYMDVLAEVSQYSKEVQKNAGITTYILSGERLANLLNCGNIQ